METYSSRNNLLLVMRQQQSRYAVPAENVKEIITAPAITPLPLQPECFRGIFSYKGHIVPVLSLRALCGCEDGETENVCVVLQADDTLLALTADAAESLVADDGQRMSYDEALMNGDLVKLSCVLPGTPAILVLDLKKIYEAVGTRILAEMPD